MFKPLVHMEAEEHRRPGLIHHMNGHREAGPIFKYVKTSFDHANFLSPELR